MAAIKECGRVMIDLTQGSLRILNMCGKYISDFSGPSSREVDKVTGHRGTCSKRAGIPVTARNVGKQTSISGRYLMQNLCCLGAGLLGGTVSSGLLAPAEGVRVCVWLCVCVPCLSSSHMHELPLGAAVTCEEADTLL